GGYTGNANIRFFNSKTKLDSLSKNLGPKAPDLSGITMDFNLDLTNDLDVEIIFDERAGEKIKTNGNGRLKFTYDSRGDIAIYGQYLFDRGTYNFTLSNAINKKFNIQAGSSITWNGSVYNGTADIKAEHELYASLNPLITESMLGGEDRSAVLAQPQYRRKYQTKVFLDLKGALLSPEITMRVDVVDNPQDAKLVQAVNNFRSVIASNEAILNQQVLSLFLFRAFSPIDNTGESNSTNLATGTISELLSNQFSNWLSSVNNNFEVQLDVNGLDANAISNLQLRLSYALLDGRLKVTRSGGVGNGNANNASAIAGDWYLEYRLTPDGKLWAKAFARNNQFYTSTLANTQTTTGASIFHTASFNSFSDLWGGNKRKKEQQKASQT
ncbi:MAG: translocation/assembly module TamB domain-containing protein, partial [Flexibacteraceae bacterium]